MLVSSRVEEVMPEGRNNKGEQMGPEGQWLPWVIAVIFAVICTAVVGVPGCDELPGESASDPSTIGSWEGTIIETRCRGEFGFTDPSEMTACMVTHKVNEGLTVNGRMTNHEEVIEHLLDRVTALEEQCNPVPQQ